LLILRIGAPLYTANVRTATERVAAAVAAADRPIAVVLVDATSIGVLSMTILATFRDAEADLAEQGVEQWVCSLPAHALEMAAKTPGWAAWQSQGRVWPTPEDAVAAFRARTSPGAEVITPG
jgi:hypothetical protein